MQPGDGYLLLSFVCLAIGFLGILSNIQKIEPPDED